MRETTKSTQGVKKFSEKLNKYIIYLLTLYASFLQLFLTIEETGTFQIT